MTLSLVTVSGTFTDGTEAPHNGSVSFAPTADLTDLTGENYISSDPVVIPLSKRGTFTTSLIATDNANVLPAGWSWTVTVTLAGHTASFTTPLPSSPSTVDITQLMPAGFAVIKRPRMSGALSSPGVAYLPLTGGTETGTVTFAGTPYPMALPSGTNGYLLASDGSGNISLQAPPLSGGVTLVPILKTGAYTAAPADLVICDTQTTGAFTVTLPLAAADKTIIGVKLVKQAGTNAVTIARNPSGTDVFNVAGGSTSLTLPLLFQGVILQYSASGHIWYVTGDDLPLGQLDSRYLAQAGGTVSGNVAVTGTATTAGFKLTTGATSTYVLTSDASGNGTWAVAPGAGGGMSNPMTTLGDLIFENGTPAATRLAGNTVATRKFLRQLGTGSVSAAPGWDTLVAGDMPSGVALLTGGTAAAFTGTVSSTQAITPGAFVLTDGASIAVDASKGNHFRVTLGGNRTLANPTNPTDGQKITVEVIQDGTGSRTLAYGTAYIFGATVPAPTLTAVANATDVLGFMYSSAKSGGSWLLLAVAQDF